MKTEVMSVQEFLARKPKEPVSIRVGRHFRKYSFIYKVVGSTIIILMSGAAFDYAFAAGSGIEVGAEKLYTKLLSVGRWIIIFKGGIEILKGVGNGDLDGVKKSVVSYLLVYLLLLGLPYGFNEIDKLFAELPK